MPRTLARDPRAFPLLCLTTQLVTLGGTALALDAAGLRSADGWPFTLGFVLMAIAVASWPLGITTLTALVGWAGRHDPTTARAATGFGAVVAGTWLAAGTALGAWWLLPTVTPTTTAGHTIYATITLLSSAATLAALIHGLRRPTRGPTPGNA